MTFFELVKARHSIRAYANKPVETEKLEGVLTAMNQAPSAGNLQSFEVYVVNGEDQRTQLAEAAHQQDFIAGAPVLLVFCAHPARAADRYGKRGVELYSLQDATIACTYAMLAATENGLASVWIGAFDEAKVSRAINLPKEHEPVAILPIGYADEEPAQKSRRSLNDLIHHV